MPKSKLYRIWKLTLPLLFIFFLIHFSKDITQDILQVKTPLDIFGNAEEDLSWLSPTVQNFYLYGLGGFSFLAEIFLLVSIPIVWKRKKFSKLEKYTVITAFLLMFFFSIATLLDPRYKPF